MRIGIDAHAVERDGSGNCSHVRGLVEGLLRMAGDGHRFVLYACDGAHPWYARVRDCARVQVRVLRPRSAVPRLLAAMPLATLRDALDVLHVQYLGPVAHRGALVVTVHDVAFESHGDMFPPVLRTRLRWQVPRALARADAVITVSRSSARDIANAYGCDPARLSVIPNGIDPRFFVAGATRPGGAGEIPFVLAVGRLNPRKNHAGVLAAFEILRTQRPGRVRLVIAGADDYRSERTREAIVRSRFRDDILLAGRVGDDQLAALYASAAVFVYPSFYEGFGLPPLEAMACGVPVVASACGALGEVLADAAIFVDPFSPASMARGIARVLDDDALAARLRTAGRNRAAAFSWDAAATATLEVYAHAAAAQRAR